MQKGSATLRWTRPQYDGGTPITTFRVERRTLGAYRWELVNPTERITETTYTVTGLQPDTDYEFRVLAENKVGVSQPSPASRSAKYGLSTTSFVVSGVDPGGVGGLDPRKYVGWVRARFDLPPLKCHILSFKTVAE